ncbi:MAG: cyclic nucleotide-binding domain-containing protein [Thermoanaerobaculales bacterium]
MFKGKPRFDLLDQYLVARDYTSALEAITEEIKRRPENFNLLLRQAEILALAGDRDKAIAVCRKLAHHYAEQGFYARAIAVIHKVLRLDPSRQDVTNELARFIAAQQEEEKKAEAKLKRATSAGSARALEPALPPPSAEQQQAEKERAASQFFTAFPAGALEQLLATTSLRIFREGATIMREGEPGSSLFLIDEGTVEVQTTDQAGQLLVLAKLGPGDFFGEVAVLSGKPRTATIIARSAVSAIEITRATLDRVATHYPEVREVLQRFYQERAQATAEAMLTRLRGGHA